MKKILMITTGGTIASVESTDGLTPALKADDIIKYVPRIKGFCSVDTLGLMSVDSTNMCPEYWDMIVNAIKDNYDNYDGFVVCHGTDTLSYTAAVLSYRIQHSPKPIVITGSQKPISGDETDAKINLFDSFLYACNDKASDVNVVFGGSVIAGTRAKKTRTKAYRAFTSVNFPLIASVTDGRVIQYIERPKANSPEFFDRADKKVGLLYLTPGMDSELLEAYLNMNDAVIVCGYGSGGIPVGKSYHFDEILERHKNENKILVMTTQVLNEGSDMTVYKVGGDVKERYGFIDAYDMLPETLLSKLTWILSVTSEREKVRELFYKTINFDILYKGE